MIAKYLLPSALACYVTSAFALFCPQTYKNIEIGMTMDQVEAACGPPLNKEESAMPLQRKVPLTQLIFNNMGSPPPQSNALTPVSPYFYYGIVNNPVDIRGQMLQVDIVDNKVYAVTLDGKSQNAMSLNDKRPNSFSTCGGFPIQLGDPVGKVYGACGTPLLTNQTFIYENVLDAPRPEVWLYQLSQFQPAVRLTFVNGTLRSID